MIAATALAVAACSWADPGANPYTGNVPAAVQAYADIPPDVRQRLQARMERRQFDDVAAITRDGIEGRHAYANLRGMHFGAGKVCATVDRSAWKPGHTERGLVYCEAQHCVIVPTVCRNVARVDRLPAAPAPAAAVPAEPAGAGLAVVAMPDGIGAGPEPLAFDAPGAGPAPAPTFERAAAPAGPAAQDRAPWLPLSAITPPAVQPWAGPAIWAPVPDIPEPATWALLAAGLVVLVVRARRTA